MTITTRTAALACFLLGIAATAGCYNPKIADGKLRCGGTGKTECPDGFQCLGGLCYAEGSTLGGGGSGGSAGAPGTGGMGGAAVCVKDFFSACRAGTATGKCDPVCQSGCGCAERCGPNKTAAMVCTAYDPGQNLAPYESCAGQPTDQCRPGSVCLAEREGRPECGAHCYRFCRNDNECESARGTGRCVGVFKVDQQEGTTLTCSPPLEACNPVTAAAASSSCRDKYGDNFACYLLSTTIPDQLICDCKGNLNEGDVCQNEHDCKPGLECFSLAGSGMQCRRVCHIRPLGAVATGCDTGFTCEPFLTAGNVSSTKIGFCKKAL